MWRAQVALFILTTETVEGETVQNIEGIFIGSGAISLTYSVGRTLYVGRSLCHSHMVTINLTNSNKKILDSRDVIASSPRWRVNRLVGISINIIL